MGAPTRPGGLAARIQGLDDQRVSARGRSAGWLLGAPVGVGLWAAGAVGAQAGAVVVACALVASWWWAREARRVGAEVDDTVDEVILQGWEAAAPDAAAARLTVLLGPRYRRRLARLLATGVYVPLPPGRPSRPEGAQQVMLHRRRLEHVVELLEDTAHPVDPRGVILVRRLVHGVHPGEASTGGGREELGSALQRIERFI